MILLEIMKDCETKNATESDSVTPSKGTVLVSFIRLALYSFLEISQRFMKDQRGRI